MMVLSASIKTIFLSRCLQGIGSSFGTVSGLGMIGSFHQDEEKKIEQMGKAMSGLAIGVLLGPPLSPGSNNYHFLRVAVDDAVAPSVMYFSRTEIESYPGKSSICTNIGGIFGLYLFMFLFNLPLFCIACFVRSKLQFEISSHTSIIFLLQVNR